MKIANLHWNRKNIEHLAKHQVLSKEVEEVVFEDEPLAIKGSQGTCYVFGQTNAGRYLFVVVVLLSNQRARVITVRDMIQRERRYYQQRG